MKRKLLIGCGCLFGLFLTVGVVSFMALRSWAMAAPSPVDGRVLADGETRFILIYQAEKSDTAAVELIRYLAREQEDRDKIPQDLKDLIGRLGYDSLPDFAFDLLPLRMGLLVDQDQTALTFVSFSKFANLITHGLEQQQQKQGRIVGEVSGQSVYQQGDEFSAIYQNTLLFSKSRKRLESALARLAGEGRVQDGLPLLAKLPANAPMVAALTDEKNFLDELLSQAKDEQGRSLKENLRRNLDMGAREFDWATLSGTVGQKSLDGTVVLGLSKAARPQQMLDSVERLLLEFVRHFLNEKLAFTNQSRLKDGAVEIKFTLNGLESFWRKQAAK